LIHFFKRKMSNVSEHGDDDYQPGLDMKQLPEIMQGRVKAMKNLQMDTVKAEAEYYREVHALDLKYQAKYDEINQRRNKVISGAHEPSGAELEWPSDDEEDDEVKITKKVEDLTLHPDFPADAPGLPKFWLHTLKNANEESLMGLIEPHDEAVLEHLTDITITLTNDNSGFILNFLFKENPYFNNQVLSKEYKLRDGPDPESPLSYDGPEIVSCLGCTIEWKEGMNLTDKTKKVETITGKKPEPGAPEEVKLDSFFSFFSPPACKLDGSDDDELSDDDRAILAVDFDVGFAIKEKIIPRAIMYFTGEIFDDDDYEDCEDEDEEEEDS